MKKKKCSQCKKIKNLEEDYYKDKRRSDGHYGICKECFISNTHKYRTEHPEKSKEQRRRYDQKNKERSLRGEIIIPETKICCTCKLEKPNTEYIKVATRVDGLSSDCNDCNRIKQKRYHSRHREEILSRTRARYRENPEQFRERNRRNAQKPEAKERKKISSREYARKKRKTDPIFRMVSNFRSRQRSALKGELKLAPTLEMLGCSSKIAFWFLEQQYYPHPETGEEMTKENYGKTTWNYDHIMPLITFDYSDPDQQRKAFHITNCQPMWADENKSRPDTRPEGVTFEDLRKPLFPGEELKND